MNLLLQGASPGPPRSVAIVAVHGVMPTPQYAFQDQVATTFCDQLNGAKGIPPANWVVDVVEPTTPALLPGEAPHETVTRVHRSSDTVNSPKDDFYDVIEAYWSPIDKISLSFISVLLWLLNTMLSPLNSTAHFHASGRKNRFDVFFLSTAVILIIVLVATFCWALLQAIVRIAGTSGTPPSNVTVSAGIGIVTAPQTLSRLISVQSFVLLLLGAVGIYLVSQAIVALISIVRQWPALGLVKFQRKVRLIIASSMLLVGCGSIAACSLGHTDGGRHLGLLLSLWFLIAAGVLTLARTIGELTVINFFRDAEIYTTRDQNCTFYDLRERILQRVTKRIRAATASTANFGVPYDRVLIFGHSLGSTIAMDALMRLQALYEQGCYCSTDFDRIRALVTFGTSLEKTKFFFDKTNPTPSQSFSQWRDDVYGMLFTANDGELDLPSASNIGIFWANYWYDRDPVCNKITSYRSFLVPGETRMDAPIVRASLPRPPAGEAFLGRLICHNEPGSRPFWHAGIAHTEYLGDDWFWQSNTGHLGVLDIAARRIGTALVVPSAEPTSPELAAAKLSPPHPKRYERVTESESDRYFDKVDSTKNYWFDRIVFRRVAHRKIVSAIFAVTLDSNQSRLANALMLHISVRAADIDIGYISVPVTNGPITIPLSIPRLAMLRGEITDWRGIDASGNEVDGLTDPNWLTASKVEFTLKSTADVLIPRDEIISIAPELDWATRTALKRLGGSDVSVSMEHAPIVLPVRRDAAGNPISVPA